LEHSIMNECNFSHLTVGDSGDEFFEHTSIPTLPLLLPLSSMLLR
jgi:hypothetical protein